MLFLMTMHRSVHADSSVSSCRILMRPNGLSMPMAGRFVTESKTISFKDETKLGLLTSEEEAVAVERRASSAGAGPRPPEFHFICEVYRTQELGAPCGHIPRVATTPGLMPGAMRSMLASSGQCSNADASVTLRGFQASQLKVKLESGQVNPKGTAGWGPSYAQAFFMTAKALHLGIVHMIQDQREVARKIHMQSQYLRDLQAMLEG